MEMAEAEKGKQQETSAVKTENAKVSFAIWPPSQRVRDAVIVRLTETLSSPSSSSIICNSKRFGFVPVEEASAAAFAIEEQSYSAAAASAVSIADGDVDGRIEILGVYAKEISKRALEILKARAAQVSSDHSSSVQPELAFS